MTKYTLNIIDITILTGGTHPDKIVIHSNLPSAIYPFDGKESLVITCAYQKGAEYCEKHFPNIPVNTITV